MANSINYDPDEHLFSPLPIAAYKFLNDTDPPDLFDLSSTDTKSGIYPSQNNSNSSPPQLTPYSPEICIDNLDLDFLENQTIDFSSVTQPMEKLRIVAQPKAFYRERYCSETDPSKNRAQRFIRADDDTNKHEYPTVQIPSKWCVPDRDLYIRVTLVTYSDNIPVVCVHPYAIDTQEIDVLRDSYNNSLYFPITKDEIRDGQKSFRISRKKMIQHDLRSYGPFRLLDLNQNDIQRVSNIHDAKQIIEIYQLWKSQLVFTIAERLTKDLLPIPILHTSITSQIMFDEASGRRKEAINTNSMYSTIVDENAVICTPRKGEWMGGDEILMVIPKLDRRKVFNIYFDYGPMGILDDLKISFVDSKTIFLQTPPCQILDVEQNSIVPLIVIQNDLIIAQIDFIYLAPIKKSVNLCSQCHFDLINNQTQVGNKRPHFILDPTESDGGESLIQQMSRLTTEEKPTELNQQSIPDDKNAKFDKYLSQLQEAIVEFVRTNNPSKLFRRTRLLLAKCDENPPPIDDGIRHGHINLIVKLIEQIGDISSSNSLLERENNDGETPLLLSAKLNHWILIEIILKKRLEFCEKTDKSNNNIFHLLANVNDDKSYETIKNVRALLPNTMINKLLKTKNKNNQIPMDVAQIKNNTHCIDLLKIS